MDKYEHMISSFHSKGVVDLDVCIKKQLIATCATDRTVRLWSYNQSNTFKHELVKQFNEETYSLALHPSGFHIVIGFAENIKMMNILSQDLVAYRSIGVKNCKEIQFSHGGQYFAVQSSQTVSVYKFYTGESPPEFSFKGHTHFIRSISWLEDDTGFVTCGSDHSVFLWKLFQDKQTDDNNAVDTRVGQPVWEYKLKNNSFNCVAIYRPDGDDPEPVVYATCTDKSIREIKTFIDKKEPGAPIRAKDTGRFYEEGTTYNQVLTSFQRKFLVCGTADQDRPASIQIFRQNFEKVLEVQAHSRQI